MSVLKKISALRPSRRRQHFGLRSPGMRVGNTSDKILIFRQNVGPVRSSRGQLEVLDTFNFQPFCRIQKKNVHLINSRCLIIHGWTLYAKSSIIHDNDHKTTSSVVF